MNGYSTVTLGQNIFGLGWTDNVTREYDWSPTREGEGTGKNPNTIFTTKTGQPRVKHPSSHTDRQLLQSKGRSWLSVVNRAKNLFALKPVIRTLGKEALLVHSEMFLLTQWDFPGTTGWVDCLFDFLLAKMPNYRANSKEFGLPGLSDSSLFFFPGVIWVGVRNHKYMIVYFLLYHARNGVSRVVIPSTLKYTLSSAYTDTVKHTAPDFVKYIFHRNCASTVHEEILDKDSVCMVQ